MHTDTTIMYRGSLQLDMIIYVINGKTRFYYNNVEFMSHIDW